MIPPEVARRFGDPRGHGLDREDWSVLDHVDPCRFVRAVGPLRLRRLSPWGMPGGDARGARGGGREVLMQQLGFVCLLL